MAMKVRSGANASFDEIIYKISTDDAKNYLQGKFDAIKNAFEKKGVHFPSINIVMYSTKLGKNFIPFMLILPEEVLEVNNQNGNYNSIFTQDIDNDDAVRMKQPVYDLLKNYIYKKEDRKAFESPEFRRLTGVNGRFITTLKRYSFPKLEDFGAAGKKVVVYINPIALFHDMLVDDNRKEQLFEVEIHEAREITEGNYAFKLVRKVKTKKKDNASRIYAQMLKHINR